MKKHKLRLLLVRIHTAIGNIIRSVDKMQETVQDMSDSLTAPSFYTDIAAGILQKLERGGLFVNKSTFDTMVNDLLLLLDRIQTLKESDRKMGSLYLELLGILERGGLEPISAKNPFNPLLHRVEGWVEGQSESPYIVKQLRLGYLFQGRVIRPAGVLVQMKHTKKGE